jgi:hypothetical protein
MRPPQIILIVTLLLVVALFVAGVALGPRGAAQPVDPQALAEGWLGAVERRFIVARVIDAGDLRLATGARPDCRLGERLAVPSGGSCSFTIPYTGDLKRTIELHLIAGGPAEITLRVPGALTQRALLAPGERFAATLSRGDEGRTTLLFVECAASAADCALDLGR